MGVVSLRAKSYEKAKKRKNFSSEVEKKNTLYEYVDEIVSYLVNEKASLIVEIDRGQVQQSEIDNPIVDYIKRNNIVVEEAESMDIILKEVKSYLWGYGVLNQFIEPTDISDISVKGIGDYWIKIDGKREEVDLPFPTEKSIENFCHSVALRTRGNLNQRNALLVTGDKDTSENFNLRINIGIKPVTDKPYVLIRKIPKWTIKPNMEKLQSKNMFNKEVKEYLETMSIVGLNYFVCGEGGSGKSTLVNALIELIPPYESKLGIQEVQELSSGQKNWNWLNVVKATGESDVEYTLEELAQQGLTMDVDRYIIGESKGGESIAIFDASFTGHKIAFTAHAPSSEQAIDKVVFNMKKGDTDYSDEKLKEMLGTLDVIIFMEKYKVCEITEVEGWDSVKKELILRPIFKFEVESDDGYDLFGNWVKLNESCERVQKKVKLKSASGDY